MTAGKRIAIVYPGANLDSIPTVHSALVLLAQAGYQVDVFTQFDAAHLKPAFEDARITILPAYIPGRSERPAHLRLLPGRAYWAGMLLARHRKTPYRCVIGVDPAGLLKTSLITRWINVPIAYLSLELMLSYELTTDEDRALKAQEVTLSRQAAFVIIQDPERGELLIQDNGLSPEKVFYVPNAPLGAARFQRSDYLKDKLGLSPETKIILATGSIGVHFGTFDLLRSVRDWPDDWVLVVHTRSRMTESMRDWLAALREIALPGRVLFSTEPLPHHDYPRLVQSADVGVVFYRPTPPSIYNQDNIRHIGLSSGKLAYFLQNGVPPIMSGQASLRELAIRYGCGEIVEDLCVTKPAIASILCDHNQYSQNALACFDKTFNFAERFRQVLMALGKL